jgi:hypothetical protein
LPSVVEEVVDTVSVAVAASVPVILTGDWMMQVVGLVAFSGVEVMAQFKFTVPVKPFDGVTVIVAAFPVVAPGMTVIPPLLFRSNVLGRANRIVTVAGSLVMMPLVTENVKLSEPDKSAGGV